MAEMQVIDLSSIGNICAELQSPMSELNRVLGSLNIEPRMRINGTGFYSADDVSRIAEAVRASQPQPSRNP